MAEPQVTVDDRADLRQVGGDGRGDARAADRGGQRQEDIGLAPGKLRVADALARVIDARQVPPGQSRPGRRDRVVRGVPGGVAAGHRGGQPGERRRRHDPPLQILI